jgi:hypothetical protein
MAIFNEILSGRFNRSLQKIFAIKGSAPVRQLGGEIMPVHVIPSGVENRYPEQWDRFAVYLTQPGVAAVFSVAQMRNPTTSNTMIVIEQIAVGNLTAAAILAQFATGPLTTDLATLVSVTNARFDPRGRPTPSAILSRSTQAAVPLAFVNKAFIALPIQQMFQLINDENQEWILLPGEALQVDLIGVNQQLDVSFCWRERALEESERV